MTNAAPPSLKEFVTFDGDRMRIRFDRFDTTAYAAFLSAKRLPEYTVLLDDAGLAAGIEAPARFASILGVKVPTRRSKRLPWPAHFTADFDDQPAIVGMSLDAKRYACWSDCGLGKTAVGLEWARQVSHLTGGGRVLICTLNAIVGQWISECRKFYGDSLPIVRIENREQMKEWCKTGCIDGVASGAAVAIVNYEKFNHDDDDDQVVSELRYLAGFALDESSRLKTGGGKQKWALIKSARGIEYKLSLTATPAPNELIEFASQASFLEKLRADSVADAAEQIIWTYFTRDEKTHRWTVKSHARSAFFAWMAGWSIYVRDPRRYGWRKNWQPPPDPEYIEHILPMTTAQRKMVIDYNADPANVPEASRGMMFVGDMNAIAANKLSQAAKGFIYVKGAADAAALLDEDTEVSLALLLSTPEGKTAEVAAAVDVDSPPPKKKPKRRAAAGRRVRHIDSNKPTYVADLIASEALAGHQVLTWTVFDEEALLVTKGVAEHPEFSGRADRGVDVLTGKTADDDRVGIIRDFLDGSCRVLVSRADMLGFGMNFQCCTSMVFSGWTFSYEQMYQAVRRAVRHGQTRRVRIHLVVVPELEGQMLDALGRKRIQHEQAIAEMELNYVSARRTLGGKERAA